jgi:hypothetical protein
MFGVARMKNLKNCVGLVILCVVLMVEVGITSGFMIHSFNLCKCIPSCLEGCPLCFFDVIIPLIVISIHGILLGIAMPNKK